MNQTAKVVGLISGGRQFPVLVARGVKDAGHRLVVVGFKGHTNPEVYPLADVSCELKLGQLAKLLDFFKENKVEEAMMAGSINKPGVMDIRHLDARAVKLIFSLKGKGDDAILRAFTTLLESESITVVPPQAYAPGLMTPPGVLGRRAPDEREWSDLRAGAAMARELGRLDIGQCVVLREGIVAAVEALEGTDAAIKRGCELAGAGCVVVKVVKPGQEERADLPSVGLDTVRLMAKAGATCLGVEAGRSLFFDLESTVAFADKAGIALVGLEGLGNAAPSS
ncbi:MAG: UDP-2,3-diacylglucosamine diphosphatase LpxI [Humidesulfovibrio sp.]|uniref:LpxI family protein n=1 Tax=Humidesulfovibrio sp. TaxID=2910988 RepID=UPI0027ED7734|nr:UDP-2,3-diacylglucosamine diphosphatase LpxI [Humidesulfovibrio sp.]MDQ7835236.1 UDP-2,3-diacylglucosamine diphosphatase LpxI [Humidesulfovibrio sp.]